MMTGVAIWGQQFLDEIREPHTDPVIRELEEKCNQLTLEILAKQFAPRPQYDWLPAHYRNAK